MVQAITAGVGLRSQHYQAILAQRPNLGWLEVHPENYFAKGGLPHYFLEQIASLYPLSLHGIGMSLGSTEPLDMSHLQRLKELIQQYKPLRVSEHMSFSSVSGRHVHDLLPMVYSEASLRRFADKVKQAQDYLGCQLLIENPSSYLQFKQSTIPEWEFFAALPDACGCALLLDVNNVFVTCHNHGYQAADYLNLLQADWIGEYHLAGHSVNRFDDGEVLIDDHGSVVGQAVWQLFIQTIKQLGPKPTLIEWDTRIPELAVLLDQRQQAQAYLEAA